MMQDARHRHCHRHGNERPCTCAMGNLYRFVEPVVLFLLEQRGPCHGYELASYLQQHALTDQEIDKAALYRTLKRLEATGHVTSVWDTGGSGPARHVYQVTPGGRLHLREWAVVLSSLASSMQQFVKDVGTVTPGSGRAPTTLRSSLGEG